MLSRTKIPEAVFFRGPTSATNLPHVAALVKERRETRPSPRLCERCQDWDVPEFAAGFGAKAHHYVCLRDILRNTYRCLVCDAIATATQARRRESEWLSGSPDTCVYVTVQGPFFLDSGTKSNQKLRLDFSVPDEVSVRLFLELTLSVVANKPSSSSSLSSPAEHQPFAITPQYRLRYSMNEPRRLHAVEDWEVDFFDAQILKGWIDGCGILHGAKCVGEYTSIYNLPSGFRVIDIVDMNVVQPSTPVRFVALSYMWESSEDAGRAQLEKANARDLESPGGLASVTLPPIISDTISLCRDLGERYLWVDRLCIVQDDEYSKPNQIDGMDRIYQSASFSIMAALDDRQGHGFPGYAGNPRRARASLWGPARSRNVGRGIDPNGMQTVVDASLWNRRGWTFQERLLSKRRLFITEYQVLFECCRGQAAEELTWGRRPSRAGDAVDGAEEALESLEENIESGGPGTDSEAARETADDPVAATGKEKDERTPRIPGFYRRPLYHRDATIKLRDHVALANYCAWVEDYTSRRLSRSRDMLNAFAGVGNAVRKAMRTETLFGLPEVYLPQALMWSHTGPAARRDDDDDDGGGGGVLGVPSWSWAAWTAEGSAAGYRWAHGDARLVDTKLVRIATLVWFHMRDPPAAATTAGAKTTKGSGDGRVGKLRRLRVKERWLGTEMGMARIHGPEKLPPLQRKMGGGKVKVSAETDEKHTEMWRACPHSPWAALAHPELDPEAVSVTGNFPGALVFNTTVASLRIRRGQGARGSRGTGSGDAEILDLTGRLVGHLDGAVPKMVAGRKGARDRRRAAVDFIVISASLDGGLSERNEWALIEGQFHEMWRFNVMLVERLPCEPFVARRLGVGYVRVSQWRECNPRWETVVLV
ncbi:hypothetical protein CH35J_011723 [Colletotrichum higginsianum]|uniref:Heterokaryon incompatibility domain-containing protein n=1 Tax=Colletotrichum higginsianum TaxID=80884 RepID=A0A4T0VF64_9PEZI|nr:hypothetical protein CH35J_011723 [Colletotrichum higginsianum]